MNNCNNNIARGGEKLKSSWTGEAVGKMHVHGITCEELGEELGYKRAYVSMILNESRKPKDAKERVEAALEAIIQRKSNGE